MSSVNIIAAKDDDATLIIIARLAGPHGVHGDVKIRSFCEPPEACFNYVPFLDSNGTTILDIKNVKPYRNGFVVSPQQNRTREYWASLGPKDLYVPRTKLHATSHEEYYQSDLIGMQVTDDQGCKIGVIINVANFGAGDLLEVKPPNQKATWMVPFSIEYVPKICLETGTITIKDPALWHNDV